MEMVERINADGVKGWCEAFSTGLVWIHEIPYMGMDDWRLL